MTTLVLAALVLLQYPYPGAAPVDPDINLTAPSNTAAIATFTGTFKSADKKYLFIDVESGNTMRIYLTRSTRFVRDDKPARVSDFHQGDAVAVDAERDNRQNLLAVRVTAVPAKPARPAPEAEHDR